MTVCRMALNFLEPKFLQIAIFEDFNFVNLLHAHATYVIYHGHGSLLSSAPHCRLLKLTAVSKVMPTLKVSLRREFLADSSA